MQVLRDAVAPSVGSGWKAVYSGLDFWGKEIFLLASTVPDEAGCGMAGAAGAALPERGMAVCREGTFTPLPDLPEVADLVDYGPRGYVFASRSIRSGSGGEHGPQAENVWIGDSEGRVIRSISVGSQFSHLAVDDAGALWVGYRDQAGLWALPPSAGRQDLAAGVLLPGICCWSADGHLSWVLSTDSGAADVGFHCYALNVSTAGVVAAVDLDNSVVTLDRGGETTFKATKTQSPSGLAVRGDHVLLLGRFEWPRRRGGPLSGFDVASRYQVTEAGLDLTEEVRVVLPDGSPLPGVPQGVCSRGDSILMHFGDVARPFILSL
ncbi:hypothetical protein [Micromonospora foliorum]|uniref:hypothetical protein n=1 Tax=Micromonospora foliorum TaxID=2911210 RepID=UPI001EE8D1DB|nr:hypothetical protein [Micromonospora foliorum]MCG5434588.1 hypothetical protein [Micromonospora foliorum]